MRSWRAWMTRIAGMLMARRRDREFDQELRTNLELHIEDNLRRGMCPSDAQREARAQLGGVASTVEQYRDRRGVPWMDALVRDLRFSVRMLRRTPGFSVITIAILGVVIGLVANGQADYVQQQRVSTGFFRVLGVPPALGREFSPEEDRRGGSPVVVLSHATWARLFASDASVPGRTMMVRGEPHAIGGVMPPSFQGITPADLWTPLRPSTTGEGNGQNYLLFARLRPGATFGATDAQVRSVGSALLRDLYHPAADVVMTMRLVTLQEGLMGEFRQPTFILWTAVGIVLLLGCVNIAGLLLVRGSARGAEVATRMALGGGRAAIIQQFLVESLVLAALGGLAGIGVGYAIVRAANVPLRDVLALPIVLDMRVLLVALGGALLTSVVFGLFPAVHASGADVRGELMEGGSSSIAGRARQWPAKTMVVAEVAMCIVLLVAAGLLIRTFQHLANGRPGFDGINVVAGTASLQDVRYQTSRQINDLLDRSLERLRRIPGVDAAAVGLSLPYERALNQGWRFDGEPELRPQAINLTYVTGDYFKTLRVPLVAGRAFTERDTAAANPVIVVNEAFVQRYARDRDPIGRRLQFGQQHLEIVGVVGSVQVQNVIGGGMGPVAAIPGAYVPAAQYGDGAFALAHTWFQPSWIVRTTTVPATSIVPAMRAAVREIDPQLPFNKFRTFDAIRYDAFTVQRIETLTFGALAGLALTLATLGVYGLVSQSVARRRRELSVRTALGATPLQILKTATGTTIVLGAAGVTVGLGLALSSARVMRNLVFGVSVTDVPTFATATGVMFATAAVAALVPALRTLRANQTAILREL